MIFTIREDHEFACYTNFVSQVSLWIEKLSHLIWIFQLDAINCAGCLIVDNHSDVSQAEQLEQDPHPTPHCGQSHI